jgi:hypothetical protein
MRESEADAVMYGTMVDSSSIYDSTVTGTDEDGGTAQRQLSSGNLACAGTSLADADTPQLAQNL